jgi:hypothetical protein
MAWQLAVNHSPKINLIPGNQKLEVVILDHQNSQLMLKECD